VFSRFIADVNADDLDVAVKAGREDIETSSLRAEFVGVLRALYNDARTRYNDVIRKKDESERGKIEDNREYVPHSLVERPMADVLATDGTFEDGSDADRHWFYLDFPDDADVNTLIERLYTEPRSGFDFQYIEKSPSSHFVKLDPTTNTFTFNTNHEFVRKHNDDRAGTSCLEDIAITETLLEVYLRDEGVPPSKVGEILQRRDKLFRSLARDNGTPLPF
ncbi:MAG: hypothetical protein IIC62_02640, partial [Proteobacteria bacterium]|nr:hypothetical protein [Pseudomonadota bacterium]